MSKYIEPNTMSQRQLWAVGALAEAFHKAGNLETPSSERDKSAQRLLAGAGYQSNEIKPLVDHMNACNDIIQDLSAADKAVMVQQIEASIKEGRHNLPAPKA